MKAEGPTELSPVAEGDGWATWISYPEEEMQRASHAIETEAGWWLVDPVDAADLDDWLDSRGPVAGVVVLLDRHTRDAAAVARRHDVRVHAPPPVASGVAGDVDAPFEPLDDGLPASEYSAVPVVDRSFWREAALFDANSGTLVVPEAVGTAGFFRTATERLGVHPALRLFPPRSALGGFEPERVLVGHGEPVTAGAAVALADALAGSRRRAPRLYARTVRRILPV